MHIIINPTAARGGTRSEWEKMRPDLIAAGLKFTEHLTSQPGDAIEATRKALSLGEDAVIAVGGDGTLNEVVNGYFDPSGKPVNPLAAIGLIPSGTGSDFRRTIGLNNRRDAGRAIISMTTRSLDVMKVSYVGSAGLPVTRYSINVVSFGLGGDTVRIVNSWRDSLPSWIGGFPRFVAAALTALRNHQNTRVSLIIDGQKEVTIESNLFLAANGIYAGGGMKFAPNAKSDDGCFDLILTDGLSRLDILLELPGIRMGRHLRNPGVSELKVRDLKVVSERPLRVDIDGESAGFTPAAIEIVPHSLLFLVGPDNSNKLHLSK